MPIKKLRRRIAKSDTSYVLNLRARRRICEYCLAPVGKFDTKELEKEYNITGYCQKCQKDTNEEFVEYGVFVED